MAIRATGAVTVLGTLSSGTGTDRVGAADVLISAVQSGPILAMVDPNATSPQIIGYDFSGGSSIDIVSAGVISVAGPITAAGSTSDARFQSGGLADLGAITAGRAIFVRASDLSVNNNWNAASIRIESTAAAGVSLGSASGGLNIGQGEMDRLTAPTVQIYAGDSSTSLRGSAFQIGNLQVSDARIGALTLYAGSTGTVSVTGSFSPVQTASNVSVQIGAPTATSANWTPKDIRVIADAGGEIGDSTTTNGISFANVRAFKTVQLNATTNILIGTQAFIDTFVNAAQTQVQPLLKLQGPLLDSRGGEKVLVTTGALAVRADNKIVQENTSLQALASTGINLTGSGSIANGADKLALLVGRTGTSVSAPQNVELFLSVTNGSGSVSSGTTVAITSSVDLAAGLTPSQNYRVNNCVIRQQGNCAPLGAPNLNIQPSRLTEVNLVRSEDDEREDPTVTSAANEEIWRSAEKKAP